MSAWATQRRTALTVRPRSPATSVIDLSLVRHSSTTSALYSSENDRRGRFRFSSMVSILDILPGLCSPIVDVRQNGGRPVRADNALALAAEPGQFDELRKALFAGQPREGTGGFTTEDLVRFGAQVGL